MKITVNALNNPLTMELEQSDQGIWMTIDGDNSRRFVGLLEQGPAWNVKLAREALQHNRMFFEIDQQSQATDADTIIIGWSPVHATGLPAGALNVEIYTMDGYYAGRLYEDGASPDSP